MNAVVWKPVNERCSVETERKRGTEWLYAGNVQKLVLVITSLETQQVLERWNFDIETDKEGVRSLPAPSRRRVCLDLRIELCCVG